MIKRTAKSRTRNVNGRLLTAIVLSAGTAGAAQSGWQAVVSSELLRIYSQPQVSVPSAAATPTISVARFDMQGRVQVDVHFDCAATAPTQQLAESGLHINASVRQGPLCVIEGWVPPVALPTLASIAEVTRVNVPAYRLKRPAPTPAARAQQLQLSKSNAQASGTPAIDGEAVTIMHADSFISQTGMNGSGVGVGVMSTDVTSLAVIQSRKELPAVSVVNPSNAVPSTNPTDEGTMMLEEVYAVAPGASLAFCGPETSTEYVECLQNLVGVGASILVDDLAFPDEDLLSSNSTFVLGVESFLKQNPKVLLFTVTENYNGSYWQGYYTPAPLSTLGVGPSATCSNNASGQTQTDNYVNEFSGSAVESLSVLEAGIYPAILQWADPFGQNVSNFDLYVLDTSGGTITCAGAAGQSNTYFGPYASLSMDTYDMVLATPDQSLSGKFLKLWFGGDGLTALSSSTPGSIISPQAFATGAITIGALNASDGIGNAIEPYSGQGPIQLIFPAPSTLPAPTLAGLDAIYVDSTGTDFTPGLFYGTSAASPNAAAVAALILSAFPSLTPAQLTNALESGATQLGSANPNSVYGYGRVDALGALNLGVTPPSLSGFGSASIVGGASSKPAAVTLGGVGTLTLSVASSNTALIPAAKVAAGSSGITIAPSSCGTSTTACTVTVTPLIGQVGSSTVTITVTDSAHRTASATGTMTVTKPSSPSISVTAGGSQSITAGGATTPVSFTVSGAGSLTVTASSSNTTLLPSSGVTVSSGCGTSTHSCTATLTPASGQTGSATVTLTALDPYQQTGTATATLNVATAPASSGHGGGGSLDFELLMLLSVTWLLRSVRSAKLRA
jgi:Subtilase family